MKSSQITALAYVTMTLLFGAALSQVVAPNPFTNMPSDDSDDSNNMGNVVNMMNFMNNAAGNVDPDTNADPTRQIFAQGYVGGRLPVNSIAKVPFILG